MNFLEIVQKVNTISGVQGTVTSVTATGYQATIVELTRNAWIDIQNLKSTWDFFRQDTTFSTVPGQVEYSITNIFGSATDPVSSYRGFLYDTKQISQISRDQYILDDVEDNPAGQPSRIAVDPLNNHLWINPPDAIYNIPVYYYSKVQELLFDTDVPICPSEFHLAIVYRAIADVAIFFGNSTTYQMYSQKATALIGSMMRSQIPALRINISGIV